MLAALATSALFLTSYLVYHAKVGSVPFQGQGVVRTHLLRDPDHARHSGGDDRAAGTGDRSRARWRAVSIAIGAIARWTLPIWLYVSVTGVVIYLMLYPELTIGRHLPSAGVGHG